MTKKKVKQKKKKPPSKASRIRMIDEGLNRAMGARPSSEFAHLSSRELFDSSVER